MRITFVDAFTNQAGSGNRAGVVLDASGLSFCGHATVAGSSSRWAIACVSAAKR